MSSETFVDFYELLQISPNADSDTLHRVYRILAQRFHPDNQESGSAETFRQITEAYQVLGDSTLRAAYDVKHTDARRLSWKIFDQPHAAQGIEAERRKRHGVLSVLYRKRLAQPDQAAMGLRELEDLLGVPKEHLEFTIWYLKEGGYVVRSDNGRVTITLRGVDLTEELEEQTEKTKIERKALNAPVGRVA
jgi:curved DNA-binding protein CbpA